ncbi:hypothetical protein CIB48_g1712 [Xylaria polymorpha]|nr:hypothetical protein CIB48_g1712 [Xylaria polymorpha]
MSNKLKLEEPPKLRDFFDKQMPPLRSWYSSRQAPVAWHRCGVKWLDPASNPKRFKPFRARYAADWREGRAARGMAKDQYPPHVVLRTTSDRRGMRVDVVERARLALAAATKTIQFIRNFGSFADLTEPLVKARSTNHNRSNSSRSPESKENCADIKGGTKVLTPIRPDRRSTVPWYVSHSPIVNDTLTLTFIPAPTKAKEVKPRSSRLHNPACLTRDLQSSQCARTDSFGLRLGTRYP